MSRLTTAVRMRQQRRQRESHSLLRRVAWGCSLILSLAALTGVLLGAFFYSSLVRSLPPIEELAVLLDPPGGLLLQPTRLYERRGEQVLLSLENLAMQERQALGLDPGAGNYLPTVLISSTLATQDPNFWNHPGYSLTGLLNDQHPTLAQQLVSDLLLWQEPPGLRTALRERLLAAQITSLFGRAQVLTWYLNNVSYGRLAFGAEAGARVYFGKPAAELTLGEAAILAAVAEAPALNPHDAPQQALEGQQTVLERMHQLGWINYEQSSAARNEPIRFRPPVTASQRIAPAFTNLVLESLSARFDRNRLERGGLRIITSLDLSLQTQADCAIESQLARWQASAGQSGTPPAETCPAALLLPTLASPPASAEIDLAASAVIYDPLNGEVLALTGQPGPGLDPAHLPGRPPGTLTTPFIYLTALARGLTPASLVWDITGEYPELENPDGVYHGPVRLRIAQANDYLIPAASLLDQFTPRSVYQTASQLGLSLSQADWNSAQILTGAGEITLLEIVQAYGIFANRGVLAGEGPATPSENDRPPDLAPLTILATRDAQGQPWPAGATAQFAPQSRPVLNPQLAYLMNQVLSDETARWPSLGHPNPLEIGRPAAAKLGQVAATADSWAIGYTPNLVVGVWLGSQSPGTGVTISPGGAAGLWHALIQYAHQELPSQDWPPPPGINTLDVCDPSGLLPTRECPNTVREVFLAGTEPTHPDDLFSTFQINRETNRLATVFTPPALVERRVFMIVPPEAADWARQAGIDTPPETFDVIPAPDSSSPNALIQSPGLFDYVRGRVVIRGTAAAEDMDFYRLQAGAGINPQDWIQIGEPQTSPVRSGVLGEWDTFGLNGLYAVQLQVVHADQHIESAIIQVTVDNQSPELAITFPRPGQSLSQQDGAVRFYTGAEDNLGIASVQFYLDDRLLGTAIEAPYYLDWEPVTGSHSLRALATDRAGNIQEASLQFRVER